MPRISPDNLHYLFDYLLRVRPRDPDLAVPTPCKCESRLKFLLLDVTTTFPSWVIALLYVIFYSAGHKHHVGDTNSHTKPIMLLHYNGFVAQGMGWTENTKLGSLHL